MTMNSNELISSMFPDLVAASKKKKSVRTERAERLFRRHSSILLTPIVSKPPNNYSFFFADRYSPSIEASFELPGVIDVADQYRNVICFTSLSINYEFAINYASMLTFLGLDVFMFSVLSKKEIDTQQGEPEARIELFDPSSPPEVIFVLSADHYKTLFGVEI